MKKIAVLGSGSWGTALAYLLNDNGHKVTLWFRSKEKADNVRHTRTQPEYLKNLIIPQNIYITHDKQEAVADADIVVISIASKAMRSLMLDFKEYLKEGQIIVNTSKGIECDTLLMMADVIEDVVPQCKVAVLSGPSHAEEVAEKIPTVVVASSKDIEIAEEIQNIFKNSTFRVYTNTDILGVELGGALKNVIAIAAGISDGMGFGDNSKAALVTRGIAEISRLGVAMGSDRITFSGLSGIGDLIVTCMSGHSRNRRTGFLLGQGKTLEQALEEVYMVVEGVYTTKSAFALSNKYNVEMPIIAEVHKALFENITPKQVVYNLMNRSEKSEHDLCSKTESEYYLF